MQVIILLHLDDLKSIKLHLPERQSLQVTPVYVAICTLSGREPRMGEFAYVVCITVQQCHARHLLDRYHHAWLHTCNAVASAVITPDFIRITPSRPLQYVWLHTCHAVMSAVISCHCSE